MDDGPRAASRISRPMNHDAMCNGAGSAALPQCLSFCAFPICAPRTRILSLRRLVSFISARIPAILIGQLGCIGTVLSVSCSCSSSSCTPSFLENPGNSLVLLGARGWAGVLLRKFPP